MSDFKSKIAAQNVSSSGAEFMLVGTCVRAHYDPYYLVLVGFYFSRAIKS